jgi:hypothetical protein
VPNAGFIVSEAELYADFRTVRLTKIIFELSSQLEIKDYNFGN